MEREATGWRAQISPTVSLAMPLIIGQLGQMLIGLTDTLMLGRLGVTELAVCAFANTLIYLPMMFGIGMSMAVSMRVSQARGMGDRRLAGEALRNGMFLSVGFGLLTVLGAWLLIPYLGWFRQDAVVIERTPLFLMILAGSMIGAMPSMVVKSHSDALNRPWPMFWISIGAVGLNVVLNWMLIFGKLGAPRMGLEGAAVATLLARFAGWIGMMFFCFRNEDLKEWGPVRWWRKWDREVLRDLLRAGIPASLHLLAEVSAFMAATFIIGSMGKAALASHQVAIQCAATLFMVPLGISMALTVRVGEAVGARRFWQVRPILVGGWVMGLMFAMCSLSLLVIQREWVATWFTKDTEVLVMAASLLMVAAAFQLSDSVQILSAGALRGLNDVRMPAWVAFGAYWLVSIPLGWALAYPWKLGVTGMWWGITAGLTLTAVLLSRRIWRRTAVRELEAAAAGILPDLKPRAEGM